jgi:hypothetical protein
MARDKDNILHQMDIKYDNGQMLVSVITHNGGYSRKMSVIVNATSNCQLMVANLGYNLIENLDKYQIRESLMRIRKYFCSKKILLFDLRIAFADKLTSSLPPSAIISRQDYVSTNGSNMSIVLVKLRSVVQFRKIPDPI